MELSPEQDLRIKLNNEENLHIPKSQIKMFKAIIDILHEEHPRYVTMKTLRQRLLHTRSQRYWKLNYMIMVLRLMKMVRIRKNNSIYEIRLWNKPKTLL